MIYLFNNKEELIHIIKEQDLIEFTHKIEINTFDAAKKSSKRCVSLGSSCVAVNSGYLKPTK